MADRVITHDQWLEEFDPDDRMYETYGADLNYINELPAGFVWTLLDDDEGDPIIVNGRAFVNRLAYYVTKKPHNTKDLIVVED